MSGCVKQSECGGNHADMKPVFPAHVRPTAASKGERTMKRIAIAALVTAFAIGSALAQETCDLNPKDKNGKELAGAAKASQIKACCTRTAVGSDGKKLKGAALKSHMDKCEGKSKA